MANAANVPGEIDPLVAPPPAFGLSDAERIASERFGVDGSASPLVSERDQNVKITTGNDTGFVLKIANPADDAGVIDMQTEALLHVARTDPSLPVMRVVPTLDGDPHVVSVYVGYLRDKIDRPFGLCSLETVRGMGYRIRDDRLSPAAG